VDFSNPVTNFYTEVQDTREIYDANAVKVILKQNGDALYFSRYAIPYHDIKTRRSDDELVVYKQIGVYAFDYDSLLYYNMLSPTYLEKMEGIGLLRLLETNIPIAMKYTQYDSVSVDTPSDRDRIVEILQRDQ